MKHLGYLCANCGKAMFYLRKRPKQGERTDAGNAYVRDGVPAPVNGNAVFCQWCFAEPSMRWMLKNVRVFDE